MLTLGLFSAMVGSFLALQFNVLILGPMMLVGAGAVATAGMWGGDPPSTIVVMCILVATSLQLGYLIGASAAHSVSVV